MMSMYISLFTVTISVNYTREFREFLKLLRINIELRTLRCSIFQCEFSVMSVLVLVRLFIHIIGKHLSIFLLLKASLYIAFRKVSVHFQKVLEVMSTSVYTRLNPFNFIRQHFLQICVRKVAVYL
jgi:hypothetical protein